MGEHVKWERWKTWQGKLQRVWLHRACGLGDRSKKHWKARYSNMVCQQGNCWRWKGGMREVAKNGLRALGLTYVRTWFPENQSRKRTVNLFGWCRGELALRVVLEWIATRLILPVVVRHEEEAICCVRIQYFYCVIIVLVYYCVLLYCSTDCIVVQTLASVVYSTVHNTCYTVH